MWPYCHPPNQVLLWSRKDTWDDLTLFMIFNVMLMFVAGIVKVTLVDGPDGESKPFALALYEVRPSFPALLTSALRRKPHGRKHLPAS